MTAAEGGLGVVQIEVSRGPRNGQIRLYHQDWRTTRVHLPGVEEARVAEHGDGIAVIVSRTDGLSVAIDADSLSATTPPRRSPVSGSLPRTCWRPPRTPGSHCPEARFPDSSGRRVWPAVVGTAGP